jgi:hypothetical protein
MSKRPTAAPVEKPKLDFCEFMVALCCLALYLSRLVLMIFNPVTLLVMAMHSTEEWLADAVSESYEKRTGIKWTDD